MLNFVLFYLRKKNLPWCHDTCKTNQNNPFRLNLIEMQPYQIRFLLRNFSKIIHWDPNNCNKFDFKLIFLGFFVYLLIFFLR